MIAFTEVSKHDTDSLQRNTNRFFGIRAGHAPRILTVRVLLWLCCCLAGLCALSLPCWAQSSSDAADNQTLTVKFISLKPGNTIGSAHLHLHANGTLDFSIDDETLINVRGTWSTQANRFSASVNFTIDKQAPFHYRLKFDGYRLRDLHAGRAYLYEYDRHERLTQEIWFLFYALPPDTRIRPELFTPSPSADTTDTPETSTILKPPSHSDRDDMQ